MTDFKRFIRPSALAFVMLGALMFACVTTSTVSAQTIERGGTEINDPLERLNRLTFAFNNGFNTIVFDPLTWTYRTVLPQPVRTGVRNILTNLRMPLVAGHQLLQGDLMGFSEAVARFGMNSFIGFGGLIDVANQVGLEYEHEDLGQTLGRWGVGHGFYLVLPVFGPSSMRDGLGLAGDFFLDPVNYAIRVNMENDELIYYRGAIGSIDQYESIQQVLDDLENSSLDYYAAVRSVYAQRRARLIQDLSVEGDSQDIDNQRVVSISDPAVL